jgi:hypothetical protein
MVISEWRLKNSTTSKMRGDASVVKYLLYFHCCAQIKKADKNAKVAGVQSFE